MFIRPFVRRICGTSSTRSRFTYNIAGKYENMKRKCYGHELQIILVESVMKFAFKLVYGPADKFLEREIRSKDGRISEKQFINEPIDL